MWSLASSVMYVYGPTTPICSLQNSSTLVVKPVAVVRTSLFLLFGREIIVPGCRIVIARFQDNLMFVRRESMLQPNQRLFRYSSVDLPGN